VTDLANHISRKKVTLLYGARDPTVNHAVVLAEFLSDLSSQSSTKGRKS